uniref:hypothetical protein n=1 Tax=Pseudoclavibacter helvolus TaxID=255205 RepID=UPI003C70B0EA
MEKRLIAISCTLLLLAGCSAPTTLSSGSYRVSNGDATHSDSLDLAVIELSGGRFSATVGCNEIGGTYAANESEIKFEVTSLTDVGGCPLGEEVLEEALVTPGAGKPQGTTSFTLMTRDGELLFSEGS